MSNNAGSNLSIQLQWKDLLLPYHDIGPRGRAPKLALVADPQGAGLNGMFVLSRLAAFLRGIEAGEQQGLRLLERVLIFPTLEGLARSSNENDQHSRSPRTLAEAMMDLTRTAYYRVDICSADPEVEEMPQVRLYAPNDDERASACLFGLPAVIEQSIEDIDVSSLIRAWWFCGGENFVIHAGQAGGLQTGYCEDLFRSMVAFLDRTGIVSSLRPTNEDEDLHYFGLEQTFTVLAEQSGIFSSKLNVGRWVQAEETLGYIHDGFSGQIRAPVMAPVAGLLASVRRQPLLCTGGLVAQILMPDSTVQHSLAQWLGERYERRMGRGR